MSVKITLDTKELDRIVSRIGTTKERILTSLAFDIEAQAKRNVPVDTGALMSSIYVEEKNGGRYEQAVSEVMARRPSVTTERHPTPRGKVIANVGPCVDYAEFVEFGAYAQPYFLPAVWSVANKLNEGVTWREMFK